MCQRKTSYPQKVLIDRIQCVYNITSVNLTYTLPWLEDPAKEEAGRKEELEDREKVFQTPPSKHRTVMVTMNSQQLCLYALGSHNSCPLNNQLQRRKVLTGVAQLTVALLATDSRGEEDKISSSVSTGESIRLKCVSSKLKVTQTALTTTLHETLNKTKTSKKEKRFVKKKKRKGTGREGREIRRD